jgi:hypothetical protein
MTAAFDYKQESKNQCKENSKCCSIIKYGRILRTDRNEAPICVAITNDCYNIWLNTRSTWNCARTRKSLIYKGFTCYKVDRIPIHTPSLGGIPGVCANLMLGCLSLSVSEQSGESLREVVGLRMKTGDAKSQPLARSQIMGGRWDGFAGVECRVRTGNHSAHLSIGNSICSTKCGGRVEPGHLNIATCSSRPCKGSCLPLSHSLPFRRALFRLGVETYNPPLRPYPRQRR